MNITIYRGTHEIGGTLIELKTKNSRILFDAGYPLFLNGVAIDSKTANLSCNELLNIGVLPRIEGLYKWDQPEFDALILSHAHIDHYGLLPFIHPDIPVYLSAGTEKLIKISQIFRIYDDCTIRARLFKMYKAFTIGDFMVKPFLMDHSAFDAAAFEISADDKTVIYTGDFRAHGRKAVCFERFLSGVNQQADLLLIEGSMLGRIDEEVLSEEQLENNAEDLIKHSNGIVLFQSSSQNIDRLVSFYKAAISSGRLFVVDVYTANVLYELRQLGNHLPFPSARYPGIKVFYPYHLTNRIFNCIGENYAKRFSAYYLSKQTLSVRQSEIVMAVRPSMLSDLRRCNLAGGSFIYSMWRGYRETDYQKHFEEYLAEVGFTLHFMHTSGHAKVEDIRMTIKKLNPRKIIPIHTMFPHEFIHFSNRVQSAQDGVEMLV